MGKTIARNKKALHDYEILDKYEAGIELQGSEVKSIRMGRVNLKDTYVRIIKGEAFLIGAHVSYLDTANVHFRPDERRDRKLLLHKMEIDKLLGKTTKDGLTIVAVARGKNVHDKRETLKRKEADREAQAAMKQRY